MRTQESTRAARFVVSGFVAAATLASLLSFGAAPLSATQAAEPLSQVGLAPDLFSFQPQIPYSQVRVTVTGPDGFQVVTTFGADESPSVVLPGTDGLYKYELRFSPVLDRKARKELAAARRDGNDVELGSSKEADQRTVQRGTFSIADGAVVPEQFELEPRVVLTNGDGVVRNSLCVGFDCPNAPAFGDSTILMMENNTRIKFGDTSNSPFPNNDWEIEANSSSSGGASYLGFNDCGSADNDGGCATDLVFAVESGARASALYVESDGDVGLGTSNPVLDLHIVTGNSPGIRLDQDGSAGFTPQVWDIVGNEANFFVRDVTAGSRLPLRIRPGAPTSSIDIEGTTGDVGIGTASPDANLDVEDSVAAPSQPMLRLINTAGPPRFEQTNGAGGHTWRQTVTGTGEYNVDDILDGIIEFSLAQNGNLTISGGLISTGGGGACTAGDPCDAVFSPAYKVPSIQEHAAFMWENSYLPAVGPTPEDGPINFTQKVGGILNELEKAHIYIEQLQIAIDKLEQRLELVEPKN